MVAVVSPTPNNQISVRMPGGLIISPDAQNRVNQAGDSVNVTMGEQDVLLVMASGQGGTTDLTGSLIESSQPVAVFSAHLLYFLSGDAECLRPCARAAVSDEYLGYEFSTCATGWERNANWATEVVYWKFVAGEQVTRFTLSVPFNQLNAVQPGYQTVSYCSNLLEGADTFVLRPGQSCEFGTKRAVQVVSDQPSMVMGILVGQEATGLLNFGSRAGDPAIFLVPPDQQYRREYTFIAPDTYFRDYVTIVTTAGNEITLDGQLLPLNDAVAISG